MVQLFRVDVNKIGAHQALKQVLSVYLGQPPGEISFQKNPNGKLLHPKIFFSLSHCRNQALIAVSQIMPIGVDIEYLRPIKNEKMIAERFFSPKAHPDKTFLDIWTATEAWVTAHGFRLMDHIHEKVLWDRVVSVQGLEEGYIGHLGFQNQQPGLEHIAAEVVLSHG